jgi:hypothetical protein
VTLSAVCETGPGGETALTVRTAVAQPTNFVGTSTVDFGTDPSSPAGTTSANFQQSLAPGPASILGSPAAAADGEFFRVFSDVLFITLTQTLNIALSVIAEGAADRCSFNGVAVPAS